MARADILSIGEGMPSEMAALIEQNTPVARNKIAKLAIRGCVSSDLVNVRAVIMGIRTDKNSGMERGI